MSSFITSEEPGTLAHHAPSPRDQPTAQTSRARYLLVVEHHVSDDVVQKVVKLLQMQGLACEVIAGGDGERYVLVTADFSVLAAQVISGFHGNVCW